MSVRDDFDLSTKETCEKTLERARKEIERHPEKINSLRTLIRDACWTLERIQERGKNLLSEEEIFWSNF